MVDALAKKQQKEKEMGDIKAEDESATLLEHLVNHTQGEGFVITLGPRFWLGTDTKILKDEVCTDFSSNKRSDF